MDDIQWKPNKINIKNVKKINKWKESECIVLQQNGKLCVKCVYSLILKKIILDIKVIVNLKINDIFEKLCETDEGVYQLDYKNDLKKTNVLNFDDYRPIFNLG